MSHPQGPPPPRVSTTSGRHNRRSAVPTRPSNLSRGPATGITQPQIRPVSIHRTSLPFPQRTDGVSNRTNLTQPHPFVSTKHVSFFRSANTQIAQGFVPHNIQVSVTLNYMNTVTKKRNRAFCAELTEAGTQYETIIGYHIISPSNVRSIATYGIDQRETVNTPNEFGNSIKIFTSLKQVADFVKSNNISEFCLAVVNCVVFGTKFLEPSIRTRFMKREPTPGIEGCVCHINQDGDKTFYFYENKLLDIWQILRCSNLSSAQ